jgi:hypothetical protein
MKELAVEWLENELARRQSIIDSEPDGFVKQTMYANLYLDLFNQAKEMEKQQIIDAYRRSTYQFEVDAKINCRTAEEYYNEIFKNK